jgi:hypothetical protein
MLLLLALVVGPLSGLVVLGTSADATALPFCRGTTASGGTLETDKDKNGFFEANSIRIEPVFARRLYVDPGRGYDAAYIGYRVTNMSTTAARQDVGLEVTGLDGSDGPVQLVDPAESLQRIRALPVRTGTGNNIVHSPVGRYHLVRATGETNATMWHEVRLWSARPGTTGATVLAACRTDIVGVQRSIAASPNKVTSISVSGTPSVGQTIQVTVEGAPGKVGNGNAIDGSIISLTPATSATWPARSVRLEEVRLAVDGELGALGLELLGRAGHDRYVEYL